MIFDKIHNDLIYSELILKKVGAWAGESRQFGCV